MSEILINSFGIEKDGISDRKAIIPSSVEVSLSISEHRDVNFTSSNSFVSTNTFDQFSIIAKWNILAHQIYFTNNSQEIFNRYIELSFNSYCYLLFFLEHLIFKLHSISLFVENPPWKVKLFIKIDHNIVLHLDCFN